MDAMKAIGVLLVCALVAVCQREDSMQPTAQNTSAEHFQSDFQPSRPRNARSIDVSVANAVGTMQRLARVTNAISLQQSIVNGSFSSDDVFSDLLRMGDLRPSSIEKMEVGGIEKAFEMMKGIELKDSEVDEFFLVIDKISREVDGVGALKGWNPETFRKDIESLSSFARKIKSGIIKTANSWVTAYDNLDIVVDLSDAQEVAKTKAALHDLQNKSMELRKMIVEEDLSKTPTFEFKKIQSARSEFSLVRKTLKGVFVYKKNQLTFDILDKKDKFKTNSDNFKAVKSVALDAGLTDLLKNILVFYKNQKSGGSQMLKKTSAFTNGLEDLKSIDEDIGDLKEIVSSANELEAALGPLKDFESLQKISNTLRTTDDQKLERLAEVIEIVDTISNAEKSISSDEAARAALTKYRSTVHKLSVDEAMKEISTAVESVDASVVGLDVFVIEMAANLTRLNAGAVLQEIIDTPKDFKSADKLQEAVRNLKKKDEAVKKYLMRLPIQFYDIIPSVGVVDEIREKLKSLDTFKKETAEDVELFEPLRANSDQVMRMLRTIKKLRNKDSMFADVIEILKQVKSSSETFGRLNSTIADKKSSPSKETTALSTQTSLKTPSEVIGTATRGIAMMKSVLEKPLVFDSNKWVDVVWREKKKVVVPLDAATLERLARIKSIEGSLQNMNREMAKWNRSLQYFTQPSYIVGFAQKVHGTDIDFSEMSKAVEALQKAISAPTSSLNRKRSVGQEHTLDDLKAELDMLASLKLNIRAHYGDAFLQFENALHEVNTFFSRFTRTIKPRKTFNPKRRPSERPRKSWKAAKFVKKDRETEGIIFTVSYVTTGFVIVAALTSLVLYCEQRDGDDDDDDIEGKWTEDEHSSEKEDEEEEEKTTPSEETGDDGADEEDVEMSQSEEVEEETIDVFGPDVMEEGLRHRNMSSKSSKTLKSTKTTSTTISTTMTDSTEVDGGNTFRSVAD